MATGNPPPQQYHRKGLCHVVIGLLVKTSDLGIFIRGTAMKRLKLFPKIFLYTMSIMLFVVVVTHGLIYLA